MTTFVAGARIDWDHVRALIDQEEWTEDGYGWDHHLVRRLFLGTVFGLTPSGKVYTPWSCRHVTPQEAISDKQWWRKQERLAEAVGLSLETGEGDPCDIFAVEWKHAHEEEASHATAD